MYDTRIWLLEKFKQTKMSNSRRRFLTNGLGAAIALLNIWNPGAARASTSRFLYAFAETLIPDGDTLGAAALGSHNRVIERASADKAFAGILTEAERAIDGGSMQLFGTTFADSSQIQRDQVFARLEPLPEDDLLGWFFKAARAEIFLHYYSQEGTGRLVGLTGPPQPEGYTILDRAQDTK